MSTCCHISLFSLPWNPNTRRIVFIYFFNSYSTMSTAVQWCDVLWPVCSPTHLLSLVLLSSFPLPNSFKKKKQLCPLYSRHVLFPHMKENTCHFSLCVWMKFCLTWWPQGPFICKWLDVILHYGRIKNSVFLNFLFESKSHIHPFLIHFNMYYLRRKFFHIII